MSSPNPDSTLAKVRAIFAGELSIERELGRGGCGVVYLARDEVLQRRVAIKTLLPELAADEHMASRFIREARFVAALQHPNVVAIHGVRTSESLCAITMQYIDGNSLDVVLSNHAPLDLATAGLILAHTAAGLQHAHSRGIVHRDVKPANVLVASDGTAVVSDFGLALMEDGTRVTGTGLVVGTLAYMSPEQRTGGSVTPQSDQYALGVMAYELFAGRRPFVGSIVEVHEAHLRNAPPPIHSLRAGIPGEVAALINRMLAKDPAARFPDLGEAERVFSGLIPNRSATTAVLARMSATKTQPIVAAKSTVVIQAATPKPVTVATPPVPNLRVASPKQASNLLYAVIGGAAAVAIAAAFLLSIRARTQSDKIESPPSIAIADSTGKKSAPAAPTKSSARTQPRDVRLAPVDSIEPASGVAPVMAATARSDSASRLAAAVRTPEPPVATRTDPPPVATAHAFPVPIVADARAVASAFVAMLNRRRWQDVSQLGTIRGDTTLRAELIRLVRSAAEFAAGFDRVASSPTVTPSGFSTECVLELTWRGGQRNVTAELLAEFRENAWQLVSFRLEPVAGPTAHQP